MSSNEFDRTFGSDVPDLINSPSHYNSGGIECIDALEACMSEEEFQGFCRGKALKYLWRAPNKGKEEDIKKAEWYLKRYLKTFEDGSD